jgi:hypothetical protein
VVAKGFVMRVYSIAWMPFLVVAIACESTATSGARTPAEGGVLPARPQLDAGPLCFDCGGGMDHFVRPTYDAATMALTCEQEGVTRCHNAGYDYDVCLRGICELPPKGPCDVGTCAPGFACANNLEATCDGCKYTTGCVELSLCQELSTADWECILTDDLDAGIDDAGR